MKKLYPYVLPLLIPFLLVLTAYHTGSPGGKTNSPGDGFSNCTDCHSGTPIDVNDWIELDIPAEGYEPGATYVVTLTGSHEAPGRFGFEMTAEDESGTKVGEFTSTDNETQLTNNGHAVTHTDEGINPSGDFKTWTFDWTAPDPGVGNVYFYAALNAANGDGTNSGDVIYTTEMMYQEHLTGIKTVFAEQMRFYPNPAKEYIMLETGQKLLGSQLNIIDLSGKTVFSSVIMTKVRKIALGDFQAGMYFIVMDKDGERKSEKLLIRE